jgi:hypothetical protein
LFQNGELKATHIVIQNDPGGGDEPGTPNTPGTPIGLRGETVPSSWTESANMPVLPVRCKVMQTNVQTNILLMKQQFFVTHTICQTEVPALLDGWVTNTPVKILFSQKKELLLRIFS